MPETLELETFAPLVGDAFTLRPPDGDPLELVLSEAERSGDGPAGGMPGRAVPFALLFHGPPERPLDQGTYRLEHPQLGAVEVFVVPVGPDERGPRYEAIFA